MFAWFGKVNFSPYTKVSAFADFLKDGHLKTTRCRSCGATSFPPRADCADCMSGEFDWVDISGKGTLHTFTKIHAAPTGFEDLAPYTVGVADLAEGGRVLAWFGPTIREEDIRIGMELQLVPRVFEETEEIKVYYTLDRPGTSWGRRA